MTSSGGATGGLRSTGPWRVPPLARDPQPSGCLRVRGNQSGALAVTQVSGDGKNRLSAEAQSPARCWNGQQAARSGRKSRIIVNRAGAVQNAPAEFGTGPDEAGWAPPSWEQVVRDHSARVYRLAYRLTGNSHDA